VEKKVAADLVTIASSGDTVDRVVYFLAGGLAAGWRHEAEANALTTHNIKLSIWDAQAISSELSEWDTFEIAATYLGVPTTLAPDKPTSDERIPDWYESDLARWSLPDSNPRSLGDLVDMTPGLRRSSVDRVLRRDLNRWLEVFDGLIERSPSADVVLNAKYEVVWATLRGFGSVLEAAGHLHDFMSAALEVGFDDVDVIDKASLLLDVAYGSWLDGAKAFARSEIEVWHSDLIAQAEEVLRLGVVPSKRAVLLAMLARLQLHQAYPDPLPREAVRADPASIAAIRHETGENPWKHQSVPSWVELRDLNAGMAHLRELAELLPITPLFPVIDTADVFNLFAVRLSGHADYDMIRDSLDDAVEYVEGQSARAERSVGRASRFLHSGELLKALEEVHEAKVSLWHGDTVGSAIEMLLTAASIYLRLDLPIASKHYALAAAALAQTTSDNSVKLAIANGFAVAAKAEHAAGQSASAMMTMEIAALAQSNYSDDPWNSERHPYVEGMLVAQALIYKIAVDSRPTLVPMLEKLLAKTGAADLIQQWLTSIDDKAVYNDVEVRARADRDRSGLPFSDLGSSRRYEWTALGISWTVRTQNNKSDVLATERLVSALQIAAAELGARDAHLLTAPVNIEVAANLPPGAGPLDSIPSRDEESGRWHRFSLSRYPEVGESSEIETVLVVMHILYEQSLLNQEDFSAVMDDMGAGGLFHKILVGRPYDELADYLGDDSYADLRERTETPIGLSGPRDWLRQGEPLPALESEAGVYAKNRDAIFSNIQYRYETIPKLLNRTIPALAADRQFQAVARVLRQEGWKDWHLLITIAGVAMNARAANRGLFAGGFDPDVARTFRSLYDEPESPGESIAPVAEYSEQALRLHLDLAASSGTFSSGLSLDLTPTPQRELIDFLGRRYHYWTDDVPHEAVFEFLPAAE
jgi:hypothetical protein